MIGLDCLKVGAARNQCFFLSRQQDAVRLSLTARQHDHLARCRVARSASFDPLGKSPLRRENHKPNCKESPCPITFSGDPHQRPAGVFPFNLNGYERRSTVMVLVAPANVDAPTIEGPGCVFAKS
jgi:hypothetical protein